MELVESPPRSPPSKPPSWSLLVLAVLDAGELVGVSLESPPRIPPRSPPSWSSLLLEELGAGELDAGELAGVWDPGVSVGVAGADEELESPPKIPPRRPPSWLSDALEGLGVGVDEASESPPNRPASRPPSLSWPVLEELGAGVGSGELEDEGS